MWPIKHNNTNYRLLFKKYRATEHAHERGCVCVCLPASVHVCSHACVHVSVLGICACLSVCIFLILLCTIIDTYFKKLVAIRTNIHNLFSSTPNKVCKLHLRMFVNLAPVISIARTAQCKAINYTTHSATIHAKACLQGVYIYTCILT